MECDPYECNNAQGRNECLKPDGSWAERDISPEMDDNEWVPSRDKLRLEMVRERIWMDDWSWMTGGGWLEIDHRRWMTMDLLHHMTILRLGKVISFSRSLWFQTTKLQSSADMQTYTVRAASPTRLNAPVPMPNTVPNQITSHTGTLATPHKPYEISLCRSHDLHRGGWQCRNPSNPYCKQLPYLKSRNEALWNPFTNMVGWQRQVNMERKQQSYSENGESACKEPLANTSTDIAGYRIQKLQTQMRFRRSFGDPSSVSTMLKYTARNGNHRQNQS